jgi:predicted nucleic acid-binding protein
MTAALWMELQAGVRSAEELAGLDALVALYLERNRMLTPSARAFQQAGRVLHALTIRVGLALARAPASLHHDALLAATSREHGCVLITDNAHDYSRIQRHLRGFRFAAPYPLSRRSRAGRFHSV